MKNLIVFLLIMFLATMANAALTGMQISVDGALDVTDITIVASTTLVIDVHVLADQEGLGYIVITPESDPYGEWYDDLSNPVAGKWENDAAGIGYPAEFGAKGDFPGSTARADLGAPYGFGYEFVIAGATVDPQLPGGKAFEYLFHCEAAFGDVIINLLDEFGEIGDTLTITQVPEPITMCLLGFGGLFLRRKSRK